MSDPDLVSFVAHRAWLARLGMEAETTEQVVQAGDFVRTQDGEREHFICVALQTFEGRMRLKVETSANAASAFERIAELRALGSVYSGDVGAKS